MSAALHPREPTRPRPLTLLVAALFPMLAQAQTSATTLPEVKVTAAAAEEPASEKTGAYTVKKSKGATGLNLSLRETPQSVSVLTRTLMDDFRLTSVNDVLEAAPGVVVEKVETDRTYYSARGFDITNFQNDGVGTPFSYGLVDGDLDTAIYDRIEVIRGANGLLSNTGNPSATVNFVRKRPTAELQASASVSYGSWNLKRIEGDVSGPLNEAKTLRGRIVTAMQDKDSYLDRYSHSKNAFYGILEADISERTTLALGHTHQKNKPKGNLWGGVPLYYSDGTQTNYDRSTSTSPDWTYWNTTTQISFIEAVHRLDNDWEIKGVITHKEIDNDSKLFYVFGVPNPVTGLGLTSWPSQYISRNRQDMVDVRASGPFMFGGRRHELSIGASAAISRLGASSLNAANVALPPLENWDGNYPEPAFNTDGGGAAFTDKQRSVFAAARLNLADNLKLTIGANATRTQTNGENYGVSRAMSDYAMTPYAGLVYDINKTLSAYAAYTEIFNPQFQINNRFETLTPVRGKSYEAGLKTELLDQNLLGSVSVFKSEQKNLANLLGYVGAIAVYEPTDVTSQGFELELAGNVTKRLQVSGGYTQLALEDKDGNDTRTHTPRRIFRVSSTYRVPGIDGLKVGGSLNWRSETSGVGTSVATTVRQPSYALLNLMARYDINKQTYVTLNVYNVTDKKYLTSLYWPDQGFYGAPRNAVVALNWKY